MDEMKKRSINKKLLIAILVVILLPLLLIVPITCAEPDSGDKEQIAEESANVIPASPVEYTERCKQIGFDVESSYSAENGHIWNCIRNNEGIREIVQVYSQDMNATTFVRVTVQLDIDKKPTAALMILKTMVRIPYEGNSNENCIAMQKWIEENLYNDKSSKVFDGGIKLEIFAPTDYCRMMDISKDNS